MTRVAQRLAGDVTHDTKARTSISTSTSVDAAARAASVQLFVGGGIRVQLGLVRGALEHTFRLHIADQDELVCVATYQPQPYGQLDKRDGRSDGQTVDGESVASAER